MKIRFIPFSLMAVLVLGAPGLAQEVRSLTGETPETQIEDELRFADSQMEIVNVLLASGEFGRIATEFQRILDLELTKTRPDLAKEAAWSVAERLREAGQPGIARVIIDSALGRIEGSQHQFDLLMLKGKIYKEQGMFEEALEVYRHAQTLLPEDDR